MCRSPWLILTHPNQPCGRYVTRRIAHLDASIKNALRDECDVDSAAVTGEAQTSSLTRTPLYVGWRQTQPAKVLNTGSPRRPCSAATSLGVRRRPMVRHNLRPKTANAVTSHAVSDQSMGMDEYPLTPRSAHQQQHFLDRFLGPDNRPTGRYTRDWVFRYGGHVRNPSLRAEEERKMQAAVKVTSRSLAGSDSQVRPSTSHVLDHEHNWKGKLASRYVYVFTRAA